MVDRPIFRLRTLAICSAVIVCLGAVGVGISAFSEGPEGIRQLIRDPILLAVIPVGGIIYGLIIYTIYFAIARMVYALRTRAIRVEDIEHKSTELQDKLQEDFVTNLVKINFKYIDSYYLQTQQQADKSFLMSLYVGIASLLIVISGIIAMFFGQTTPAYVTTASGVLGQFISAVFFYLYNNTILKMSEYHRKLVLTQNIGLALKISDGLQAASRERVQERLIDSLSANINAYLVNAPVGTRQEGPTLSGRRKAHPIDAAETARDTKT